MPKQIKFKFDADQEFQLDAIQSIVDLFDGLGNYKPDLVLGGEIIPNLPPDEMLFESHLQECLHEIQERGEITKSPFLEYEEGLVLEGTGQDIVKFPYFTVEMETGTGKTYVYLRTIYELYQRYGFTKFIIVVPSIAIYEGVQKAEQVMRSHFASLYENTRVHLTAYEGRLNRIRSFAQNFDPEILLMTIDSFNKAANVIYRPTDKIQGTDLLPYQFIQKTRPIVILDEPQSIDSSEKAKSAIRTLNPLFGLRFSATHRTRPNLIYRLTPVEAFKQNLVKKIQVIGLQEMSSLNEHILALEAIEGTGSELRGKVKTVVQENNQPVDRILSLKKGDNLFQKTRRDEHQEGFIVSEISKMDGSSYLLFENETKLMLGEAVAPLRSQVFNAQIEETIRQHFLMQTQLQEMGIKVLSLFFVDRVANFTDEKGIIKKLFDENFERLKKSSDRFAKYQAHEVRSAYFAKKKEKGGNEVEIDTESRNDDEKKAEREAFKLIMKEKERLLSFDEPVSFIFAHSALKEGWDNPNVFQICTLNETISEIKKRQEIGRGLRLAVNQNGDRIFDTDVNLLTVVANQSYDSYAASLQNEYIEAGDEAPEKPKKPEQSKATRRDDLYNGTAFQEFWKKLNRKAKYQIKIDTPTLIDECIVALNQAKFPQPVIVLTKGKFVITEFSIKLEAIIQGKAKITVTTENTLGQQSSITLPPIGLNDKQKDLSKMLKEERLRNFKIVSIEGNEEDDNEIVKFGNGFVLSKYKPIFLKSEQGQPAETIVQKEVMQTYPIFDIIGRAMKETGLTKPTLNNIFIHILEKYEDILFKNPEGFTSVFVETVKETLANHIAEKIAFEIEPDSTPFVTDEIFPKTVSLAQAELADGGSKSLYDLIKYESNVELNFLNNRLRQDEDNILVFFKFPSKFRIDFPRVIHDYNPDWGIVRLSEDGSAKIELVRETKGTTKVEALQFPSERRKIYCATKFFQCLGIDYRPVDDNTIYWW